MTTSRSGTRVLAWGAAAAVAVSGLTLAVPGAALAAAPAAPSVSSLSPNSSVDAYKDLELTWSAVPGATRYDIQILDDANEDLATIESASTTLPRWTVPVSLPTGQYLWRVRATTAAGTSAWSSEATLVRGWESQVTGLATSTGERVPTLSWNPLPDASFYELEISPKPFVSPQYSRKNSFLCWTSETTYTPYGVTLGGGTFDAAPGNMSACALAAASPSVGDPTKDLIYGSTYYWRVRGRDGSVDSATTPFPAPSAGCFGPWLESGITVEDGDAGGKVVTVPVGETAPTTVPAPECSSWSAESTFVPVSVPWSPGPAGVPTGLSVAPLAAGSTTRVTGDPTFAWAPVPDAVFYRLYVSRDRQIDTSLDFAGSTQATSLTPASGLGLTSTPTYWAVQACTVTDLVNTDESDPSTQKDCGPISAIQEVSQVTTNPATPASLTDAGGYLLASWHTGAAARAAAKAYDVELTNVETGAATVTRTDRISSSLDSGTSSLVLPSTDLPEGSYTFRVRPVAESDRYTAWSVSSTPVVLDKAAPTVRLASPAGFVDHAAVQLTFSEPVSNVSATTLGVSRSDGVKVAGTVAHVSGNTWSFTPTAPWIAGAFYQPWTSSVVDRAAKPATAISTTVRAGLTDDSDGQGVAFATGDGKWFTYTDSDAMGGSFRATFDKSSTTKQAYAATTVYGSKLAVGYCKMPSGGSVKIYVDGVLKSTVSQYQSYTSCGSYALYSHLATGFHTVKLVAAATSSTRGTVSVDRITVG